MRWIVAVALLGGCVEPCADDGAVRVCGDPPAIAEALDSSDRVVVACAQQAGEVVCDEQDVPAGVGPVSIAWPPGRPVSVSSLGLPLWSAD